VDGPEGLRELLDRWAAPVSGPGQP
jgi:hypothetical protein